MVECVAASKLETQDLVSVIASSLTGQRFRTLVICCSPFLDRTQTSVAPPENFNRGGQMRPQQILGWHTKIMK